MTTEVRNTYLDAGSSDQSDQDTGYDSEAAEISKVAGLHKRRKIEHEHTDDEEEEIEREDDLVRAAEGKGEDVVEEDNEEPNEVSDAEAENISPEPAADSVTLKTPEPSHTREKKRKDRKKRTPGVIYLSSLPPYLKPSALRNLLEQRGFSPIARLFLSPASKSNKAHSSSGKNSRQLYTEGWIEFSTKTTAKRCAETLNASTVGGKKGGYYRDDVWNMKYLRGMRWEELMAGVREEKREMEGRRDDERRTITRETKMFVEGVEEGRRQEGMKRKRDNKKEAQGDEAQPEKQKELDVRRTWRQNEVMGQKTTGKVAISDDVKQVLGKIF